MEIAKAVKTPPLLYFLQVGNLVCVYDGIMFMWLLVTKITGNTIEALIRNNKILKIHYNTDVLLKINRDEIISINLN